jgi:hypothetical protein
VRDDVLRAAAIEAVDADRRHAAVAALVQADAEIERLGLAPARRDLWKTRGQIWDNIFATDYLDDFARVFSSGSGAKEYLFLPLANLPRIVKNQV